MSKTIVTHINPDPDADLVGCPVRLVVSDRNGEKVEWKRRDNKEVEMVNLEEIENKI